MSVMTVAKSEDGVPRATVKITFRVDRDALVQAARELLIEELEVNRAAVVRRVRRELQQIGEAWFAFGQERYVDGDLKAIAAEAERAVARFWPT